MGIARWKTKKRMPKSKQLKSPNQIEPFSQDKNLHVIIETPRNSHNKYKFDPELGAYRLNRVLPEGMVFPYDFGFVPQTRAQDGDPLDVLLLLDEPVFSGCVVEARVVGIIEAEQSEGKKTVRNDRVLAVAAQSHIYGDIKRPGDLHSSMIEQLELFFVAYNKADGKKFKILGCKGPDIAMKLIEQSRKKK